MKIVASDSYGCGFCGTEHLRDKHMISDWMYDTNAMRTDPETIEWAKGKSGVQIIEIPDDVTDWEINEYDGKESVIYVVDGKIYWAGRHY